MKKNISRIISLILLCTLAVIIVTEVFNESTSRVFYVIFIFILAALVLIKGLKTPGILELIEALGMPVLPFVIKLFAGSQFAENVTLFCNKGITLFYKITGIETDYQMENEEGIVLTFCLLCAVILFLYNCKDQTAMKIKRGSDEQEFKKKNFAEKSEMFCITLRQRLESINKETEWNETLFTPIEAEVEVNIRGKRKKKFTDLIKCLRSVKHKRAIFLVLGEPGSGKSVSLRKLCSELLDESKETKKIPVYVNLKKWNKDWNLDCLPKKKDLIDFIKETLYDNGDFFTDDFLDTYFERMLEDGRWYFVFDSFDELPCLIGKHNCQELIDKISELLCQFMTGANQSGGIIASRFYKSPSEAIGAAVVLKLQEFNDIKIKIMLQKYLSNAGSIIKKLFRQREDLVVLCRNPFYLTLLIDYVKNAGLNFPENQMELYKNFVDKRLNRCSGKIENEHLDSREVHNAAKKLAVFMQESSVYGLECPIAALLQKADEKYWRKILKLLEYAKLCRLGGENESVSFVHRRFQEFFLVESMIERNMDIQYEDYKSIVNNAGMRDALVLYCEVIEEEKAKEIAGFCWQIIKKNMACTKNILERGSIELVNVLYFMTEAFRNRKSAIAEFKEEFEQFIDTSLSENTDFVVLLACTNSMVLFEQEYLQQMVLKVFQLKIRWLNDVVIQNCRIFNRLDGQIERKFINYFLQMGSRTFLERFRNIQFSLSLSKNFRYLKTVHFLIFLFYIVFLAEFLLVLPIIIQFNQCIEHISKILKEGYEAKFIITDIHENGSWISNSSYFAIALGESIPFIVSSLMSEIGGYTINLKWTLSWLMMVLLSLGIILLNKTLGYCICMILIVMLSIFFLTMLCHDIRYIIKKKGFINLWNKKKLLRFCSMFILIWIVTYIITRTEKLFAIFILGFAGLWMITIARLGILGIKWAILFFRDRNWIRHQAELGTMTREDVAQNLNKLRVRKSRWMYIEGLLQRKVQLTGSWPDNVRPKYDDKLELILAKLDCLERESYNYLF